jgi:type II secretory pathway component GspD/PulD (secretin)
MKRHLVWAATLALGVSCAWAQEGQTRLVRLQFADATCLAAMLGGTGLEFTEPNPDRFVLDSIVMAASRLPGAAGRWQRNAAGQSYPGTSGAAPLRLPAGITQPPLAVPQQNALLLRGSADALDRLEEIIALLDKPQAMVNIELTMLDTPEERVEQWGVDFQAMNGNVAVGTVGNAPATGLQLRWALGNLRTLAGWDVRSGRGRNDIGANVTTFDNTPATVSFGETLPFFVSHVTYDLFGNRHVDTEAFAIFAGIELWVHPRITGGDTVTMRIVPTITEATGAVTAPDGSSIPITKTIMTDTQVRVRDGDSLMIGGFQRYADETTQRFRSLLGETRVTRSSHPVLLVTPHIIRPQ